MIARERIPQRDGLHLQLCAVRGDERDPAFFDVRRKTRGGMSQEFIPVGELDRAADRILADADRGDVYLGAAPRFEAAGGRRSIRRAWTLWADCDSPSAVQALEEFEPAPHLVLASGTPGNLHAW